MLTFAHRGYHATARENTLEAFSAAIELKVDGIETDVWLTTDGQLVLYHDRLTPTGSRVDRLTRAELCRQTGYDVPGLAAAVDLSADIVWNIELKAPAAAAAVAAFVASRRGNRFLLTSFFHPAIVDLAKYSVAECGLLIAHRPLPDWRLSLGDLRDLDPSLTTVVCEACYVDQTFVAEMSDRGMRTMVYGTVTEEDHRQANIAGVDGIITDHPQLIRTILV
jgi:glycerophosphoryl diester phosphodiesterase